MYKLLIIHIFLSIIFLIFNMKNSRDDSLYKFIVVLFIPLFGFIYFFFVFILKKFFSKSNNGLAEYEKYIKNDVHNQLIRRLNIDKEINIVPVNEALIINESKIKRNLLIDLVKDSKINHIELLKKALENNDTETSHYAAVAIAEVKKQFETSLYNLSYIYEQDKTNVQTLISYVDLLKNYLQSTLLDETMYLKIKDSYSKKLSELLNLYTENEQYFIDKINCDMELNNFLSAGEYCKMFLTIYKNSEESYLMCMKFYYTLKDYQNFKKTFNLLKKSKIKLSNKGLNLIRFWNIGDTIEH